MTSLCIVFLLMLNLTNGAYADGVHARPGGTRADADGTCIDGDPAQACTDPGAYLREFLTVLNQNRTRPISAVLQALRLDRNLAVGAEQSHSLQQSRGLDDPRLHLRTRCGYITVNLSGHDIEMNIVRQTADTQLHIPGPAGTPAGPGNFSVGGGQGRFSETPGEILLHIDLPRNSGNFTAADIVNRLNPDFPRNGSHRSVTVGERTVYHDTHNCSQCHVHNGAGPTSTHGSLGVRALSVGDERVYAIVSPYFRAPGEDADHDVLCAPVDLRLLFDCRCRHQTDARCRHFGAPSWPQAGHEESCARLRLVLGLNPRQNCRFSPTGRLTSQDDPVANQCFADRTPPPATN